MSGLPIRFIVPGSPVAKARPRVTRSGRAYTPKRSAQYESVVALVASASYHGEPLDCPVLLEAIVLVKRPLGLFRKKDPVGRIRCTKRPDLDNYLKALMDGVSKAGIWKDDSIVTRVEASKFYTAVGEDPGVLVSISADAGGEEH